MSKVLAIIQARIGSSRLPNKVFLDISGKPMLWHVISRLKYSGEISDIVLAIPETPPNDKLEDFAKELQVKCFRGSENDVLSRYYGAAVEFKGDIIVRLTSDCPLIDPKFTDDAIQEHKHSGAHYTSRGPNGGFPRGLDSEVFNFEVLETIYNVAKKDYEREHVTPYIYQHPELFKVNVVQATGKLKRPELRITVDTEEDLQLIREIYKYLYHDGLVFSIEDVIDLLDKHTELLAINAQIRQKELSK